VKQTKITEGRRDGEKVKNYCPKARVSAREAISVRTQDI